LTVRRLHPSRSVLTARRSRSSAGYPYPGQPPPGLIQKRL
jgi:hypothetical protein